MNAQAKRIHSSQQDQPLQKSLDQRMSALQRANDIRIARANLKKDLKGGNASILDLLGSPPDYALNAKFFDLLIATPKYGKVKAYRIFNRLKISPNKTVGSMSDRQRREMIKVLRG